MATQHIVVERPPAGTLQAGVIAFHLVDQGGHRVSGRRRRRRMTRRLPAERGNRGQSTISRERLPSFGRPRTQ